MSKTAQWRIRLPTLINHSSRRVTHLVEIEGYYPVSRSSAEGNLHRRNDVDSVQKSATLHCKVFDSERGTQYLI